VDLAHVSEWLKAVILLGAFSSVVFAFFKWVRPTLGGVKDDAVAIRDTLVGRPAVLDSITGAEISPAVPSIGQRQANQEAQMALMAGAISELAINARRVDSLEKRVTRIEEGHLERIVTKAEAIAMWNAMETVAHEPRPDDN
jgi:hypothetical protein